MQIRITLSEDELLRQLFEEDPAALQHMIAVYFPILCRFAEKFLPDSELAKDIVQETFIKFWKHKRSFTSLQELKGFLYTITRNGCLNLQRGRIREAAKCNRAIAFSIEDESIYDEITRLEYLAEINKVVRSMPDRMQEVFLLSFEDGLSIDQIAKKLQISLKTVRNQKYKSLQILRNHFKGQRSSLLLLLSLLLK